ncbi:IscA/HesB family protein [Thiovibrio frasassiensis]|uniref:IscA/HesB family protein n=1 Tax=Thiovibrio frasassiensis TaxID=2984131 RepID=A0A9X4MGI6_9BACT|nr:IscA/HesB family protein [Thiovibrio frasassiensis]MDG4477074.1 IscA/HesB family protein [Thiovibrio frasassiensis]
MLEVTQSAITNLKEHLAKNNLDSAIRVVMQSGCAGVSLGLGLDEKKDSDRVFEEGGITFLVDGGMFAATGAIKVDFVKASSGCGCGGGGGFAVSSEKKLDGGGCGGGSCSSGSCAC